MIRFTIFIGGWIVGMLVLAKTIFPLLLASVKTEVASAILIVLLMVSYTVVWGTVICRGK